MPQDPPVVFHRLAAREYRRARAWYRRRSPTTAERFRAEVDHVVQRISEAPLQGACFRGNIRWMRTRRFPYLLFYEPVDSAVIRVYAVAQARRRLGYWFRRQFP